MSKATMHNSEASLETCKLKDELSEEELNKVSGGGPKRSVGERAGPPYIGRGE